MPTSVHSIRLTGVRQNNLKNLDLDIRVGRMTVVTGLSGAGKSSLVFETLHAEGQRRYVETFNAYTRQFLEMMGRPDVDAIENIRPSIAIEQKNSVRTTRSTVGTMTELCDYFKAWFPTVAALHDPATGAVISDDSPQSAWSALAGGGTGADPVLLCFPVRKPENLEWGEILDPLARQGYTRGVVSGEVVRLAEAGPESLAGAGEILVVQDRMKIRPANRSRFLESATTAFRHGHGRIRVLGSDGAETARFSEGLRSPATGRRFRSPVPSLFSFNSPIGACPTCKGFGRVIGLDRDRVVPDPSLSLEEGAVRPFQGKVYSNSLDDLRRHAGRAGLRMDVPWEQLSEKERAFVWEGDPDYPSGDDEAWIDRWYGIDRFFAWLERNVYKMHVRVFLSKYRSYDTCPDCGGARLAEESRCWRWRDRTLPDLYRMEIAPLLALLESAGGPSAPGGGGDLLGPIRQRLRFLVETGLGYLTLDRPTRTLSGGETERVNLTTCLGTSMVDTLFVLDEPSVGLHPRDIDRLVGILRGLTAQGNTVVVVEHDERIMRAADRIIEIGPEPGRRGGRITFEGTPGQILRSARSLTGAYLSGRRGPPERGARRPVEMDQRRKDACGRLSVYGATKHNLREVDLHLPLGRFVCVSGVSGSGKSTLLHRVIHDNLLRLRGEPAEDPARVRDIDASTPVGEVVRVDQSSLAKTPRSNPALLTGAWEEFRKALAATEEAVAAGMTPGTFSFNAGDGRCEHCQGLGYEQVEMQFLSDIYLPCPVCEGRRFKPEVLAVRLDGLSVDEILAMEVDDALARFAHRPAVRDRLEPVGRVGLGYLPLGHPLNQLSGGESQRLKLVRHLGKMGAKSGGALILVDEPTTGLHRHDIGRLLAIFQELVGAGNSLVVVEHHPDVLAAADYLIEMGPGAGADGGRIVACGTPEDIAAGATETAPFLREAGVVGTPRGRAEPEPVLLAAEPPGIYEPVGAGRRPRAITVEGATEHNLRDVRVEIPHGKTTVIAGVSGSGKSTLAFDIIFAEGQRRFLESMSAYARQFVEQLPKPSVRRLTGLAPSVAIEQRVTHGTAKSTVATITEVAQYLRLLFARIGVQHNPRTGNAVLALPETSLIRFFREALPAARSRRRPALHLGAPLVRGRKGHHQPLADWAADRGFPFLVCDGDWTPPEAFRKLDRYREHDIDLILGDVSAVSGGEAENLFREALRLGHGSAFLEAADGSRRHFSRSRVDPETGEGFPDPEPKMFSWNSPRGWCPTCRGRGTLADAAGDGADEPVCPDCGGTRLCERSRHVFLETAAGDRVNLPDLLSRTASDLIRTLSGIRGGRREKRILAEILPEIRERLQFMDRIGLDYLTLDRATRTLSGGEAQRIRLTSQLGSNLTGVLYVLDEPTIGLHARDNERLLASIDELKKRGNTVLVVEHDEDVILAADRVIDMGPGAGVHGGGIVAEGTPAQILRDPASVTGRCLRRQEPHPLRGERRPMPRAAKEWIRLEGIRLRNWKGGDVRIPRRRLTGVCGVSGAGKSTLVREALRRSVAEALRLGKPALGAQALRKIFSAHPGQASPVAKISGLGGIRRVVEIDQSPIGKTPRSTPATYIGVFDLIRASFASLPEARMRGLDAGAFSFNTVGGRCEACKGAGTRRLEMNFLPDASVVCEECGGRRYRPDILEILWRDRSIADVLEMSFEEAAAFFDFDRRIRTMLDLMVETGLGYLHLGQPSPTLSGGEAQRLKLVSELAGASPGGGEILYLLEEPTIGLHLGDCARLAHLLHRLVDEGNTVVVIEHQADILAEADHLLEIGPGGGAGGGEVLHSGPPEQLAKEKKSPTGPCLRALLRGGRDSG
ncbi:MAG: excinuclease ABC subunit UvrA [Puniceicoccaceae bacterium]